MTAGAAYRGILDLAKRRNLKVGRDVRLFPVSQVSSDKDCFDAFTNPGHFLFETPSPMSSDLIFWSLDQ